ncbi:hypothetical protein psal_cds_1050 [Pandoravirus salinus]|uniref:Ankyrin repeat domain containing protein n=1 Tax=Pandoravirus salinus TaxID=1349410 RepID=S4VX47_9VIRU|nr:hypothetical protein psal_cds_1050 [Pandoravirus salinus]AGO85249.1 hypothetical protein psal_cds_1050 [Pandoravirus salinus]
MEASVVLLPVEIISAILNCLDDPAYCAARQAHPCFRVDDAERVERRACLWRGCTTLEDFCLRGNTYAVARIHDARHFKARRIRAHLTHACVVAAARGGHLDVLSLLRRLGCHTAQIHVARGAARGGHVHILDALVAGRMPRHPVAAHNTVRAIIDEACRGDHVDVFAWACGVRDRPPTLGDIQTALGHGAIAVALYCESCGAVGFDWLDAFKRAEPHRPVAMAGLARRVMRDMSKDARRAFGRETMRRGRIEELQCISRGIRVGACGRGTGAQKP